MDAGMKPGSDHRAALPPAPTGPGSDDYHFHTITVRPIKAYCYEGEAGGSQGKHVNLSWATKLSRTGANLTPPPSADTMPFSLTPPSPEMDVAVRNMLICKVLVVSNEIRAAFPLTIAPRLDGTYDVVQDFRVWEPRYPRRNYIKLLVSAQTIQRISPYDKMIKIKLTDIFNQLRILEEMQLFCGVHYRGSYFAMTRLPPRHPRSAHIAQRWVEVVGDVLERKFEVYCVMYQDEWLIHAMDFNAQEIVSFIEDQLGVDIDKDKSVLEPTTDLEFFGVKVNCAKQTVRINDETRDIMISCMKQIDQYETRERESVACLWWWVAYHHRLPKIIEDDILAGKADLLSIVMQKFDVFSPRELKRARRKIFIYADVLKGKILAYAPEFNVKIDENIPQVTPSTLPETVALLSAIGSAKWALKTFVPDRVDLIVFINSAEAYSQLTRGSYSVIHTIINSFIKLYKNVKSRNVIWQSTESNSSVKELLNLIDDIDEETPLSELVKNEVSKPQKINSTWKAKQRQFKKLNQKSRPQRKHDLVPVAQEHSAGSSGSSSITLKSTPTDKSHIRSGNEASSDPGNIDIEEPSSSTSKKDCKSGNARSSADRSQAPTRTGDCNEESTLFSLDDDDDDEDSLSLTGINQNMVKCVSPFPSDETSDSSSTSLLLPSDESSDASSTSPLLPV